MKPDSISQIFKKSWFPYFMWGIWIIALIMRFWHLDRFNTLVFDEYHFAKFARYYLGGIEFSDGHPPLSKFMIAVGIWLHSQFLILTGQLDPSKMCTIDAFGYRWINAVEGSFLPLLVGGVAYELGKLCRIKIDDRERFAVIAALLLLLDGLYLVESRYALTNIHLLFFGFLGLYLFFRGVALRGKALWFRRSSLIAVAGLMFGCSAAVKWNGLGFLGGAIGTWVLALSVYFVWSFFGHAKGNQINRFFYPIVRIGNVSRIGTFLSMTLLPALIYFAIWVPHIQITQKPDQVTLAMLLKEQTNIFEYHKAIAAMGGNDSKVHPYCSAWYKWPLMLRTIGYFYEQHDSLSQYAHLEIKPLVKQAPYIYDVHGMGNPFLFWFATFSLLVSLYIFDKKVFLAILALKDHLVGQFSIAGLLSPTLWIYGFLIGNFVLNILPWLKIDRCTFLYHYMPSAAFSFIILAWFLSSMLSDKRHLFWRFTAAIMLLIVFAGFVIWSPIFYGLPLDTAQWDFIMKPFKYDGWV
ncbi:MAG: phospholipid carrier-dependent glycosyltransferase [Candidatus Caenarcaniphilales bacterium]|nr:phospholipid carrier-dependent glycosyltransferase [Candidatus Caenarcaniphilales bacterium]